MRGRTLTSCARPGNWSNELALKGTLRAAGIEPPKFHDVGRLLLEHQAKFSLVSLAQRIGRGFVMRFAAGWPRRRRSCWGRAQRAKLRLGSERGGPVVSCAPVPWRLGPRACQASRWDGPWP